VATPVDPASLDHAVQLYMAGKTIKQIESATGVNSRHLYIALAGQGVPTRGTPRTIGNLPAKEIADAYQSGESEYSLSKRYDVSRNVLRQRLVAQGVEIRSWSEAGKVRASKMTPKERAAQAAAAHNAVRGATRTYADLCKNALGRERVGRCASPGEQQMVDWLHMRGLGPIPQKAIGKYNVDVAMAPVAVEVLGGGWHAYKPTHAIRTPEILNAGWHLAFVWDHEGDSALTEHAADHVISWLEEIRRDPPSIGQYRVISGSGQLLSTGSAKDDKFPLVPPPRGRSGSGS
jgi:hypothetical protein